MVQIGDAALRSEVVDAAVKCFAVRQYKFKQAVSIVPTNAWNNVFWRENPDVLAAGTTASIEGVPPGAAFPQLRATWTRHSAVIKKHAAEVSITWEDILAGEIDVQSRQMFKLSEAVTKSVDDEIYDILSEGAASGTYGVATPPANINQVAISAAKHWSGTSAAILDNIYHASQFIASASYSTQNLICFVSPNDKRSIMRWVTDKGAQFNSLSADIAINGGFIKLGGISFVETMSVPASNALVVVPKICGTWKELVPFSTTTISDPYRSTTLRAVEEGLAYITDPKSITLITNTQGPGTE